MTNSIFFWYSVSGDLKSTPIFNRKEIEIMKKLLALLMALALVFSLAACGGKEEPETTAPEVTDAVEDVVIEDEATTLADVEAVTEETTVEETTVEETTAAAAEMTAAEFAEFFNAETAKIAKSGKYTANRNCEYTSPIDVGGATDTLNKIIKGIDSNASLDSVVGDFLGIGTKKANIPAEEFDDDYKVKAATLKASDLGSFKAEEGKYTFTLANATDPKKTGATPFSRFTNDFITHEEVVEGIAGFTTAIKVNSTTVNYKNIKVAVTVEEGKITNIEYSYAFDAKLGLKALVVNINGTGAAVTKATFSNIQY